MAQLHCKWSSNAEFFELDTTDGTGLVLMDQSGCLTELTPDLPLKGSSDWIYFFKKNMSSLDFLIYIV